MSLKFLNKINIKFLMSKFVSQEMDKKRIVELIKLEAHRLELASVASSYTKPPEAVELETLTWPESIVDSFADLGGGQPHIRDFIGLDSDSFLKKVYSEVLKRLPDSEGYSHYLNKLLQGEFKQNILWVFVNSKEGKEKKSKVQGLGLIWGIPHYLNKIDRSRRLGLFFSKLIDKLQRWIYFSADDLRISKLQTNLLRINQAAQGGVRNSEKLFDRLEVRLRELDCESRGLKSALANACQQIRQLEYQLDNISSAKRHVPMEDSIASISITNHIDQSEIDRFYFAFEEACRGAQSEIYEKLSVYLPYLPIQGSKNVVDIGCGRGEWLEVLGENGFNAKGLDINEVMVQICLEKKLDAELCNLIDHFSGLSDGVLSGVTGFHVAEHISLDLLLFLFKESHRVLEKGGVLILETPNPENMMVGSHTFYHDPTHNNPLTPTLLSFMAQYYGYESFEIIRLSPYPESAKVPGIDPLTERVNGHFCGPQDFALIAYK